MTRTLTRQLMEVKTSRSAVSWRRLRRRGVATLDYVLVLGAALPMMAMSYYYSVKIIRAVYQMTCALVCWPFM